MNAPLAHTDILQALPIWLQNYTALKPESTHPRAARLTTLVAQALPIVAEGLAAAEREVVEHLLFARLMLDAAHLPQGASADGALDIWLAATVLRMRDWPTGQRRAWWQLETLFVMRDALVQWTTRNVLLADAEARTQHRELIAGAANRWVELSMRAFRAGAEVGALFELDVSEGLLDCVNACGIGHVRSLRASALLARAKVAEGGQECRK